MSDFLPDDPFWLQNLEATLTPSIDEIRENVAAANADEPHSDPSEYEAALEWLHRKGPKIAALLLMEMDQAEKWRKTHADLAAHATRAQGESAERWARRVKTLEARLDLIQEAARGGFDERAASRSARDEALKQEGAIEVLVRMGHADACAKRIVWGDGECECGRVDARGRVDTLAKVNDTIGRERDYLYELLQKARATISEQHGEIEYLDRRVQSLDLALSGMVSALEFLHDDSDGRPGECLGEIAAREIKRWRKAHGGRWEP